MPNPKMHRIIPSLFLTVALAAGCRSADEVRESARQHEAKGASLLQTGKTEEGVGELKKALEDDPGSVTAAITLAAVYEQAGAPLLAIRVLEDCLDARPGGHLARMGLGRCYARLGEYDRALQQYAIVGKAAAHAPAFLAMADIYDLRGQPAASERAILAALDAEPSSPAARYRLARLYDARGIAAARGAWERYLNAAIGISEESDRMDEARARLRLLAPRLEADEKVALLAALRRQLELGPPAPAPTAEAPAPGVGAAAPPPIPADAGPQALRRYYPGRLHVKLYIAGTEPVRGAGSGATFYEALLAALEDVRRSRLYDLFYANALDRARAEVSLEVGGLEPLAVDERAGAGSPLGPDDLLELRVQSHAVRLLPSDRVARGLSTLRAVLEAAARDAGLGAGEWRRASLARVPLAGFVESQDGGGTPLDLEAGLPAPSGPEPREVALVLQAAASWIQRQLGTSGAIPAGYDPVEDRVATATARAQAFAVVALADAAAATGDDRCRTAAQLGFAWLAAQPLKAESAAQLARAAIRLGDAAVRDRAVAFLLGLEGRDGAFPGGSHATAEAALALAEASGAGLAPLREPAKRALGAAERGAGETPSAAYAAADCLLAQGSDVASEVARLAPRSGSDAGAIQANLALAAIRSRIRPRPAPPLAASSRNGGPGKVPPPAPAPAVDAARLRAQSLRAALRLFTDPRAGYLFETRAGVVPGAQSPGTGAFREAPFDPRISLEEDARLVSALAAALPWITKPAVGR